MKEQGLKWLRTHDLISNKQRNRIYEKVQHQKAYVESRKDASFVLSETSSEMDGSAKKKKKVEKGEKIRDKQQSMNGHFSIWRNLKKLWAQRFKWHIFESQQGVRKKESFFSQCQNKQLAHT